jgi:hypothetical protein
MSVFNSISARVLIVLLMAGLMMGLSVAGIDLLNPNTSAAEANLMNIEAAHKQATYEVQERLDAAKTDAEIQAIQRDQDLLNAQYQHDIQILAQDVANRQTAFKTWMTILVIIGSAMSIAIVISTIMWVGSKVLVNVRSIPSYEKPTHTFIPPIEKTIHPLPEWEPYDPWATPIYRRQRIKGARQEERKQRKEDIAARMESFRDPARMTKEEYNKRPLAGD